MATKKTTTKRSRKRKNEFADSIEVNEQENSLKSLLKQRSSIEGNIKDIISNYNARSVSDSEAERWLDRLPLENLKELQEFSAGGKDDYNLSNLKIRSQLRKDRSTKIEELQKVDQQISLNQIDVLLAKVNFLIKKVGNEV